LFNQFFVMCCSRAGFLDHSLNCSFRSVPPAELIVATSHDGLDLTRSSPGVNELHAKRESRQKTDNLREALLKLADDCDRIDIDTPPANLPQRLEKELIKEGLPVL
jgi:chromosome partitioning protein